MEYVSLSDFKTMYLISGTEQDNIIIMFIKNAQFIFDFGKEIHNRDVIWKQKTFMRSRIRLDNYPINTVSYLKLHNRTGAFTKIFSDSEYYIDKDALDMFGATGYFIEVSANVGYFDEENIPEEIKGVILSIAKMFYDDFSKNMTDKEVSQKTIGRFSLSYFQKKIETTGIGNMIDVVRSKYGIEKVSGDEVKIYMV